jgi:Leucine-rich repeat (LRR) protein
MLHVKYIDDDLYEGATKKAFPTLKKMRLDDLPNLERVLKAEGVEMLSQLSNLTIDGIPKQLAFPSLPYVDSFVANGNTERDSIDGGASFLRGIAASMHNLKKLDILDFKELKVLPHELNSLSSLHELHISCCYKLESIPECVLQGLSSLQVLKFIKCSSLNSLPESMNKLTSLRELRIQGEYENGTLLNCIEGIPSLQKLYLSSFRSLATLPDWLGTMTSLQLLHLSGFPKLTSLPASFKELKNLRELRIYKCPMLKKRCKIETGEDWHKIAHVPILHLYLESTDDASFQGNLMNSFPFLLYLVLS